MVAYLLLLEGWEAGKLVFQVVKLRSPHFLVSDHFNLLDPGGVTAKGNIRIVNNISCRNSEW
jgi:hypothetical protein